MFEDSNTLYNILPDNIKLHRVNCLDIPFDHQWKIIGVNLSGGADSALLTFLLCKIIEENKLETKIDIITYNRCWSSRPWQGFVSMQVFEKLKSMFPKIIHERHTAFIPPELEHGVIGNIINNRSGDQIIVGSFNTYISWQKKFNAVFNATSKNYDNSRSDRMLNRDKDAKNGILADLWYKKDNSTEIFCYPFKFVKKDWIIANYYLHNILDLLSLTRSCEGDINMHDSIKHYCNDFTKYIPGMYIPECRECWWCKEREWAYSRVDKIIEEINEF